MSEVSKAVAALKRDDFDTGLASLIALWRETHSSALADAIDQLSAVAAGQRDPFSGRTKMEQAAAWDALVSKRKAGDFSKLFNGLITVSATKDEHRARLEVLKKKLGPDPRLSSALLTLMHSPPRVLSMVFRRPFWEIAFRALHTIEDPRAHALAITLRAKYAASRSPFEQTVVVDDLARLIAASEKWQATERPVDVTALTPFFAARAGAQSHEALEAAYRSPADLALRQVCADALSEAGDPRGEFIALQLAGRLTPAQRKRHEVLFKQCRDSMLGPIAAFAFDKGTRFKNGFPFTVRLGRCAKRSSPTEEEVRAMLAAPQWSTVEAIDVFAFASAQRPLVEAGSMRSIKRILNAYDTLFEPGRELGIEDAHFIGQIPEPPLAPLFKSRCYPKLKKLSCSLREKRADLAFRGLWRSTLMLQLEWVFFSVPTDDLEGWQTLPEKLPANVKIIEIKSKTVGYRFDRTADGWAASLWVYDRLGVDGPAVRRARWLVRKLLPGTPIAKEVKLKTRPSL